uniref:GFO/IDH/MocA-like oxidoreductase domain-containing protein n=1 Tax=Entomoneis paludosa TaxID=265537 RepID=A0A7S2YTI0_9STRA|mmetsp:Transcript_9159/g.19016  ORF Transcript_9159/g.19016 Transcript_9159/m.19016 type:complete len:240 (+) Transcript_9159:43-762(+)
MPQIGQLLHITASFASPVMWVFEDPHNVGWNVPTGSMLGNGFAWGQQSHLLAWIFWVCGVDNLIPQQVYCSMNHCSTTGADIAHSATITCANQVVFNVSGTALLPGSEYAATRVGKQVRIQIYGSQGALFYEGDDERADSGRLEFRGTNGDASHQILYNSFQFENATTQGCGPESVADFVQMCCDTNYHNHHDDNNSSSSSSQNVHNCANARVGLRTVQTLEAMYRSHATKSVVQVRES